MAGEAWNTSELLAACCGGSVKVWSPLGGERKEVALTEAAEVHALDWSGNNKVRPFLPCSDACGRREAAMQS